MRGPHLYEPITSVSSSGDWSRVTDGYCSLRLQTLVPLYIPRDAAAMATQLIVILRNWQRYALL
jgi:hypothetical protein